MIIQPHRNWRPNRNYRFHNQTFINFNFWSPTTFGYGNQYRTWSPGACQYWVEDSLVENVVRAERFSNSMRANLESQVRRGGYQSDAGVQNAISRVQRLDEALEQLRANLGYVSDAGLRDQTNEVLALGQAVSTTFQRSPDFRQVAGYDWDDLSFQLNELARYYDLSEIR